jgi:hypothetical protein
MRKAGGSYNTPYPPWRVWRYQQCTEIGTFDSARGAGGPLSRTRQELCDECRQLFGEFIPVVDTAEGATQRRQVSPMVECFNIA